MIPDSKIYCRVAHLVTMFFFIVAASVQGQTTDDQVAMIINNAVEAAGGEMAWLDKGTLVVHETQIRETDGVSEAVSLVHYMDTAGKGYRLEMVRSDGDYVFAWDGHGFWATKDGRSGDHELEREARRVISDAYFRFSLPFILAEDIDDMEYAGTDQLNGMVTQVLKTSYSQGPADRYFSSHSDDSEHNSGESHSSHEGGSGHHGDEIYYFHFNDQNRLVKVYFSHHGDGNFETLLLSGIASVQGILREDTRRMIRHDGSILYDAEFTYIGFDTEVQEGLYRQP
jgi:hypothetical protein